MQFKKMSPEQAEALAKRDRNRLIVMSVLAVLVGGAYLVTTAKSKSQAEQAEQEAAAQRTADRGADAELDDILVKPFGAPEVLEQIRDAEPVEQDLLEEEPLNAVFDYARLQTDKTLRALGRVELDAARQDELMADPGAARLAPVRARGRVVAARMRPRDEGGRVRNDWIGTLESFDGRRVHFLVAGAPVQPDGERRVDLGDYLRVDGLFHAIYRTTVDGDAVAAPLVLGANLVPSSAPMTEDLARRAPALAAVADDGIGEIYQPAEFEDAFWQLMGRAKELEAETDWETAPELNTETLAQLYEDGASFRGQPFRVPVSINMDTYSRRIDDNPLRLDRQTEGWIGNSTWKGSVKTVKWFGPFTRQDMLRETFVDDHRYVVGNGYFFRNHVFMNKEGQPIRAPIFVMSTIDVFVPEEDKAIAWFKWGILGLTGSLTLLIFLLLRSDRAKSRALYEDMIRRRRARRERSASQQPTAADPA